MRSRARGSWDGVVFFVLAVGGTAGALWISYRFELRPAETAASLLPSLAGLWLSWAAFRAERAGAAVPRGPAEIADQLAVAVRNQWDTEVRMRRMNDPYPLAVSWRAADADLGEAWPELLATADGFPSAPNGFPSAPDGSSSGPGRRVAGPADLAGAGAEITEVFLDRLPTRRLLVLGEPGTGKTVLLVRLLLALIERRAAGGAVPVLFPLASWNPARQPLDDWMAERLARDYTGLGDGQLGHAQTLLEHRLILPVLDGFDEIPQCFRGMALDALNAALPLGHALVLSSRVTEYRDALAPPSGVPVRLAGAAAVELQPLDADDIAAYLRRDAGGRGTPAADRWEPVIRRLGTDAPVARALRTPLMLFLARTVYNPRPDEHAAALPSPAELCDPVRFPDRAALESHLFDAFVPAAYRPHPRHPCRWSPRQAERALRFLARQLHEAPGGRTDLAWWHLPRALPPRAAAPPCAARPDGLPRRRARAARRAAPGGGGPPVPPHRTAAPARRGCPVRRHRGARTGPARAAAPLTRADGTP
ncbi:NACHT domain-containing protein [Streptomyces sp. NRRL S-118]|uniref:NACHT domain-containing protein n=1 Tax=Streptomyces sp. NRRL S-118 TaxID=1463881 RepID=UPI00069430E1|nr:NACHT domain-containing protein [Streptomyces sp. NRRL S-118]